MRTHEQAIIDMQIIVVENDEYTYFMVYKQYNLESTRFISRKFKIRI